MSFEWGDGPALMVDGKLGADGMNRRDGPLRRAEPRIERMTRMSRVRKPALSGED